MEYTLGTLNIPLKTNIEKLFNKIGITRYMEMSTVKDKITTNVCQNKIDMKYFIKRFEQYISIFQEDQEGKIIGIVTFDIESDKIKIHNLCANVKGVR